MRKGVLTTRTGNPSKQGEEVKSGKRVQRTMAGDETVTRFVQARSSTASSSCCRLARSASLAEGRNEEEDAPWRRPFSGGPTVQCSAAKPAPVSMGSTFQVVA
jgi:hypothetical protein